MLVLALACRRDDATLTVGGVERTFLPYVADPLAQGAPLILVLHGSSGTAEEFYDGSGWRQEADELGAAVAFLQGQTYCVGGRTSTKWNVPGVEDELLDWADCGHAGHTPLAADPDHGLAVDDPGYVRAVVAQMLADHPEVDPDRVYLTGFSNGGSMVGYLVEQIGSDLFAAAGSAGGSPSAVYGVAAHPVPVLHTIGSVDEHYTEADRPIPVNERALDQPFVAEVVTTYASVLGVDPTPYQYLPDEIPGDEPTATFLYGVDGSYTFAVLGGMGHHYPPLGPNTVEGGASFDMPALSWDFFVRHTRGQ